MLDLTIIIPTNRPHEKYVRNVINNINSTPARHSYEIAVCSEKEIEGDNVKWYKEHGQQGPIAAFNRVVNECRTDYVCCLVDDHVFTSSFSDGIKFLEKDYKGARFPITTLSYGPVHSTPVKGQLFGYGRIDFDIECHPMCKFPLFHKRALKELGGCIFHPDLFYHAGDILLGYYMGMNGEPCRNSPVGIRPNNPAKDASHEASDCEIVKKIIKKYVEGGKDYIENLTDRDMSVIESKNQADILQFKNIDSFLDKLNNEQDYKNKMFPPHLDSEKLASLMSRDTNIRQFIREKFNKHVETQRILHKRKAISAGSAELICHKEASRFISRSAFEKGSPSAYGTARRNGWLDDICGHMSKPKTIKK